MYQCHVDGVGLEGVETRVAGAANELGLASIPVLVRVASSLDLLYGQVDSPLIT